MNRLFTLPLCLVAMPLALGLNGCATHVESNPSTIHAYSDTTVLAEIPLPESPWKLDANAPSVMYRESSLPRIKGEWVAAGAPSPLPRLAALASMSGWRIVTSSEQRLSIRLATRVVHYKMLAPGRLAVQAFVE